MLKGWVFFIFSFSLFDCCDGTQYHIAEMKDGMLMLLLLLMSEKTILYYSISQWVTQTYGLFWYLLNQVQAYTKYSRTGRLIEQCVNAI